MWTTAEPSASPTPASYTADVAKGPTIPEGPAFTAAWRSLDRDGRRRVRRAVNRVRVADDPKEAALAVAVARGQRRFWRWGWALGPLLAMLLLSTEDLPVVIANGLFAVVLFGALAWLFTRRAQRAEALNLERARPPKHARRARKGGASGGGKRKR